MNATDDDSDPIPEGEATAEVPHAVFSVDDVAPCSRYEVWKESISCIFDVDAAREIRSGDFRASVDAHMFGQVMLARTTTARQKWNRSPLTIARDGMDHYMIQLYESGGMVCDHRRGSTEIPHGGLIVFDLSQEAASRTDNFTNISLIVPRTALAGILKMPDDQHMRTLAASEPMVALLRDHMMSLKRLAGRMSAAQGIEVAPATVALAAACLNASESGTPGGSEGVRLALTTVVKRAIEANLHDPALSPDAIAKLAGVSRSKLYAVFDSMGGVHAYVRERRLNRVLGMLLADAHRHRPIYDIAMDAGFVNESAFSRAFRKRYGMSPRDVRHCGLTDGCAGSEAAGPDRRYERWLHHLSV